MFLEIVERLRSARRHRSSRSASSPRAPSTTSLRRRSQVAHDAAGTARPPRALTKDSPSSKFSCEISVELASPDRNSPGRRVTLPAEPDDASRRHQYNSRRRRRFPLAPARQFYAHRSRPSGTFSRAIVGFSITGSLSAAPPSRATFPTFPSPIVVPAISPSHSRSSSFSGNSTRCWLAGLRAFQFSTLLRFPMKFSTYWWSWPLSTASSIPSAS